MLDLTQPPFPLLFGVKQAVSSHCGGLAQNAVGVPPVVKGHLRAEALVVTPLNLTPERLAFLLTPQRDYPRGGLVRVAGLDLHGSVENLKPTTRRKKKLPQNVNILFLSTNIIFLWGFGGCWHLFLTSAMYPGFKVMAFTLL